LWKKWGQRGKGGVQTLSASGAGYELTTLVVIGTDGIGSHQSNYNTIKTTTAPE
jgi:hypothetical protein